MRKILRQKFWSLGTNLGSPRALGVAPVVQPMFWRVFLFKFGMVYMMTHPIALEKIFLIKLASSDMCYALEHLTFFWHEMVIVHQDDSALSVKLHLQGAIIIITKKV